MKSGYWTLPVVSEAHMLVETGLADYMLVETQCIAIMTPTTYQPWRAAKQYGASRLWKYPVHVIVAQQAYYCREVALR